MKRLAMILAVIFAAGAGAYATTQSIQERPSNEPVQVGAVYQASFCTTAYSSPVTPAAVSVFHMRVMRELNRGWIEVQFGGDVLDIDPVARAADRYRQNQPIQTGRINLNSLCFVKPIMP